jgi:hypothetical protein
MARRKSSSASNFLLTQGTVSNSGGLLNSGKTGRQKRRSHTVKSHTRVLSSGKKVRVKRHRRSKKKG